MDYHPYEAFLFDMDGVIIDTHAAVTAYWHALAQRYAVTLTEADFARHVYGCTADRTLDALFPMIDQAERVTLRQEMEDYEINQSYTAMPGALDLLRQLKADRMPAALVTSGAHWKVEAVSAQLSLEGLFTTTVTSDAIRHSKPHPEGYLTAAARLGKPAQHCIVFEDALSGVEAARAAGALCIGVGTVLHDALQEAGACCVVPTLEGLRITHAPGGGLNLLLADGFSLALQAVI